MQHLTAQHDHQTRRKGAPTDEPACPQPDILCLNEAQRDAITQSTVRLEIMDAISDIAPCSISELAEELARSPQSLYYHIDILRDVGLVEQVGARKAGKRDEAVYDLASRWFRFVDNDDPKRQETLLKLNETVLRLTRKSYEEALRNGYVRRINGHENIYFRRQRGRLTDEALEKVYEHINAIGDLLEAGKASGEGDLYSISLFISPLEKRAGDS